MFIFTDTYSTDNWVRTWKKLLSIGSTNFICLSIKTATWWTMVERISHKLWCVAVDPQSYLGQSGDEAIKGEGPEGRIDVEAQKEIQPCNIHLQCLSAYSSRNRNLHRRRPTWVCLWMTSSNSSLLTRNDHEHRNINRKAFFLFWRACNTRPIWGTKGTTLQKTRGQNDVYLSSVSLEKYYTLLFHRYLNDGTKWLISWNSNHELIGLNRWPVAN